MRKTGKWPRFGRLFFILWAALCTILFIYYPGRISHIHGTYINNLESFPSNFQHVVSPIYLLNLLKSFTGIVLFSFASMALGSYFLNILLAMPKHRLPDQYSPLALTGTAFLFGHAVFSLVLIFFGHYHRLTPILTLSLMITGLVIGFRPAIKILPISQIKQYTQAIKETTNTYYKFVFWLCASILSFSLLYSSSRVSYDAVAFYFSDERITALTHQIQFFQNNSFVASSFQAGIQYAALMQIFGDQSARIYPWINGVVIILFGFAIAEKTGLTPRARLIWVALLLTSTAFIDLTGDGKIDLTSTNAAIAAVYWLVSNQKSRKTDFLIGLLAGLAIALRPFNAFLLSIFIILVLLLRLYAAKGVGILSLFISGLWVSAGTICMIVLHIYINWLILGNPFAMLSNLQVVNPSSWQWTFDSNYIWVIRLLYPLSVTFMNVPQSNGNITPIFVAFLPVLLFRNIREKTTMSKTLIEITIAALITLGLWINLLFTVVEIRYVLFLWILIFMPMAVIIESVFTCSDLHTTAALKIIFAATLLFISLRAIYISIHTYSPIDRNNEPQCRDSNLCNLLEPLNKAALPGDRVLVLNAFRYYLRSDLLMCSSKHDEYEIIQNLSRQNNEIFWNEIYRQGYKYITYEKNYGIRHLFIDIIPNPNNVPKWMTLAPIYGSLKDDIILYQIHTLDPPINPEKECKKNSDGIWEVRALPP